jgi:2'-hydroxyisoflavone reductase
LAKPDQWFNIEVERTRGKMKILILGGTKFVGRHIAEALLNAGHEVSVFTRGQSKDELPSQVERLHGDRNQGAQGLHALEGRSWDACVDVSGYTAGQVRPSAELLRDRVKRYVFISAVSVYSDKERRPVRETDPRLVPEAEDVTEVNGETYGRLKVTCENIVQEVYGERATFLRPQIVAGPHDHTARYPYWIGRVAQGGEMLAPGDGSDHLQVIDARDLAKFAVKVIEDNLSGPYNMSGPRITWTEFMKILGAKNLVWVSADIIEAAGLTFVEMPIFRRERGDFASHLMDVSHERSVAAGLRLTDPRITMEDTRAWSLGAGLKPALSPELEAELIKTAREKSSAITQ